MSQQQLPTLDPFNLFPLDADYLFNYTTSGLPISLHTTAEQTSQAVAVAAALFVSPAAALNIARGFVLSRIASCSDRDPLANGERWIQKKLFFPETIFSGKKFGEPEADSLGFGPKITGYYLRFAVLGWLMLMILPLFLAFIFVRPVAPIGKVIAVFFSFRIAIWGFQSGLLLGDVSSPLFQQLGDVPDRGETMIVDYVLGLLPVLLPVFAILYFTRLIHPEVSAPIADDEEESEKNGEGQNSKKSGKRKNMRKNSEDSDDPDYYDDEEMEEVKVDRNNNNNAGGNGDEEEEEIDSKTKADREKRKRKKTNLRVAISKVQFKEPGVVAPADAAKSWRMSLKNWMNTSRIARFLFIGNYCWQGGDLPILNISSFEELKKKRQLRAETKKKQLEEDIKSGKRKRKWYEPLPSESDDDEDDGSRFQSSAVVQKNRYVSRSNFFDDDEPGDDDDGNNNNFFDDDPIPNANEDDVDDNNNNQQNETNDGGEEKEEGEGEKENDAPKEEGAKNEDDVDIDEEERKKQEAEEEKKKLFDTSLDYKLPPRPPVTPAQFIFNRLGAVLEDFYGPPEPLSIEEANRRKVRLPWREAFSVIAPHYFAFAAVLTTVTCILAGMSAAAPEKYCTVALVVNIVAAGVDLLFLLICFPFIVPVQNIFGMASDGVVLASGILAQLQVPAGEQERLALIQLLTLFVVAGIGGLRIIFVFIRFILMFAGKLAIVSIYFGKKEKDIRVAQRKLRLEEAKQAEKNRRETEAKQSSAVIRKKGGPYSGIRSLESSFLQDQQDDDDLLLMPLPKMRTSSRFKRRTKSLSPAEEDDAGGDVLGQKRNQDDDEDLLFSPSNAAASTSASPNSRSSRRGRRNAKNMNGDDDQDDIGVNVPPSPSPTARTKRERKPRTPLATTSSRRNLSAVEI